jgi:hypothetical protein
MKGGTAIWYPLFPGIEYKPVFMTECFELVYHGGGGFSWSEVWNMPVLHRRFNIKKINAHLEKLEQMRNEANQVVTNKTDMSKVKIPKEVMEASKQFSYHTSKKAPKK